MTFGDAAALIIQEMGRTMTCAEIWDEISKRGLVKTEGKTPSQTLATELLRNSANTPSGRGSPSPRFYRQGGAFGLWANLKPDQQRAVLASADTPSPTATWERIQQEAQEDQLWVSNQRELVATRTAVLPEIQALIKSFVQDEIPLSKLSAEFDARSRSQWKSFGFQGPGFAMILNMLAKQSAAGTDLSALVRSTLALPATDPAARVSMQLLHDRIVHRRATAANARGEVAPKAIPRLASAFWHLQNPSAWPVFYASSSQALLDTGVWKPVDDPIDSYFRFRHAFQLLASDLSIESWDLEQLCKFQQASESDDDPAESDGEEAGEGVESWIFQSRPTVFDTRSALAELREMDWPVRRHRKRIGAGDKVFLWESARDASLLAVATVLTQPEAAASSGETARFFVDAIDAEKIEPRVSLRIDQVLTPPISRQRLQQDPVLAQMGVFQGGTPGINFQLDADQVAALDRLIEAHRSGATGPRYWKISPGEQAKGWPAMQADGVIAVSWADFRSGDLRAFSTKVELDTHLANNHPSVNYQTLGPVADQLWRFRSEIHPGDIVVANRGQSVVVGEGEVTGEYFYRDGHEYPHAFPVRWTDTTERDVGPQGKRWNPPIVALTAEDYEALEEDAPESGRRALVDRRDPESARRTLERLLPEKGERRAALELLSGGITEAHRLAPDGWNVVLFPNRVQLNVGRLQVLALRNRRIWIAVRAPSDSLGGWLSEHGTQDPEDTSYRLAPEIEKWTLPSEVLPQGRHVLGPGLGAAIYAAVQTMQGVISESTHSPGVLAYLESVLGPPAPPTPGYARPAPMAPASPTSPVVEPPAPYGMAKALDEVFLSKEDLEEILALLEYKRNLVLSGPPGVGKTFVARSLAYLLMEEQDEGRLKRIQFHQSYSYEDFVRGYRPSPGGGFDYRDGPLLTFCDQARRDSRPHVLLIDEINRGNLSKILGELMMLIEPDKRDERWGVELAYAKPGEGPFWVPPNVYIIGTMNTADRSLALVDYALRRRFVFWDVRPAFEHGAFESHLQGRGATPLLRQRIKARMAQLNAEIEKDARNLGRGFSIGHSYFCGGDPDEVPDDAWYARIVKYEIAPLLREYWAENPATADKHISALLEG